MQDLVYELPRIPIPRTSVNRGKKKGRMSTSNLQTKASGTLEGFGLLIFPLGGPTLTAQTEGGSYPPSKDSSRP